MILVLHRKYLKEDYTIGNLYVKEKDGSLKFICNVLEDKVRELDEDGKGKVFGETAIPYDTYGIDMDTVSPKFSNYSKYPKYKKYDGKLPRLLNVKHFDGVLIHIGTTAKNTQGCLLVGENKERGKVLNSTNTFYRLMDDYLLPAHKRGESISITIV